MLADPAKLQREKFDQNSFTFSDPTSKTLKAIPNCGGESLLCTLCTSWALMRIIMTHSGMKCILIFMLKNIT